MSTGRQVDLLKQAAKAMENGEDPFHISFLSANDVSLDEAYDMAGFLALGAQLIAWAIEHPKDASAAVKGATQGLHYKAVMDAFERLRRAA